MANAVHWDKDGKKVMVPITATREEFSRTGQVQTTMSLSERLEYARDHYDEIPARLLMETLIDIRARITKMHYWELARAHRAMQKLHSTKRGRLEHYPGTGWIFSDGKGGIHDYFRTPADAILGEERITDA